MFRPTVIFNAASRAAAVRAPVSRIVAPAALTRFYSAAAGLSQADIESRVLDILRGFDKVDGKKVQLQSMQRITPLEEKGVRGFMPRTDSPIATMNTISRSPWMLTSSTTWAWTAWTPSRL